MRFFAQSVLRRSYEETSRTTRSTFAFDTATRTIWRRSDVLTPLALSDSTSRVRDVRRVTAACVRLLQARPVLHPLFRIPGLGPCGLVVHPRDEAIVAVQRWPARACKVVPNRRFASILDNEREAARLAPALAPAVLDFVAPGDDSPGCVMLEYVPNSEPLTQAEFGEGLQQITDALVAAYRAAGVTNIDPAVLNDEVRACRGRLAAFPPTPFVARATAALDVIEARLESTMRMAGPLYRTFVHGDVQRSNLRRHRGRLALIDWATGGPHNVLFDAFTVELFSPTLEIWPDIVAGRPFDTARGFSTWLPRVLHALRTFAGVELAPGDVSRALVASLCEKALTIADRHAGGDETRGLHSLARVERLLAVDGSY